MNAFMDLGVTTPPNETCAQVGSDKYHDRARHEARLLMSQIRRTLGPVLLP